MMRTKAKQSKAAIGDNFHIPREEQGRSSAAPMHLEPFLARARLAMEGSRLPHGFPRLPKGTSET